LESEGTNPELLRPVPSASRAYDCIQHIPDRLLSSDQLAVVFGGVSRNRARPFARTSSSSSLVTGRVVTESLDSSPNVDTFDSYCHLATTELALNGVHCRANNCFDINGVPHLAEQMNARQPAHEPKQDGQCLSRAWGILIRHGAHDRAPRAYLMSASLVSRALAVFTFMMWIRFLSG
jgi:hypothetical protein